MRMRLIAAKPSHFQFRLFQFCHFQFRYFQLQMPPDLHGQA
jgi:hypothetical protein